jgi:hypothetical protein
MRYGRLNEIIWDQQAKRSSIHYGLIKGLHLVDFSQLSNTELIQFVDGHFELFASEWDEAFPDKALSELERDIFGSSAEPKVLRSLTKGVVID